MIKLSETLFAQIKEFIFKNSRLLERILFSYFFENRDKGDVLKTLASYQNKDGGFGNGIEPDLLCPDSTVIGAETALYILEMINCPSNEIEEKLINWIKTNQNEYGYIDHPPPNLFNYPHQKWWENPDNNRIFVLAGLLKKRDVSIKDFFNRVRNFFLKTDFPTDIKFYDYPYFVYLKYCSQDSKDEKKYSSFLEYIPNFLKDNRDNYPLLSRYWFFFIKDVEKQILIEEAEYFVNAIQDDGGLKIMYQNLPWWRPLFTLDGLVLLKKNDLIEF